MSKILLIERNTYIREALEDLLHVRFPDLLINSCFSLEECDSQLLDVKPDILFIGATEQHGEKLTQLHRIREHLPGSTLILFTEYDIDEYRHRAIMEGVNYVISKELWTGSEILALVTTILKMKDYQDKEEAEQHDIEEKSLKRPLDRRRKGRRGKAFERGYLADNADRRIQK